MSKGPMDRRLAAIEGRFSRSPSTSKLGSDLNFNALSLEQLIFLEKCTSKLVAAGAATEGGAKALEVLGERLAADLAMVKEYLHAGRHDISAIETRLSSIDWKKYQHRRMDFDLRRLSPEELEFLECAVKRLPHGCSDDDLPVVLGTEDSARLVELRARVKVTKPGGRYGRWSDLWGGYLDD